MGSGKTSWAINHICENRNKSFIYITPYLDEIKRLKEHTKEHKTMYEPNYIKTSKTEHFHNMLMEGKSICSTHALFKNANDLTRDALACNNYTLILDEVMNVVEELADFTKNDMETLINEELAYVEDDYLKWNPNKLDYNGRYNDIKNMSMNNNIICINDKLIFWNFPVDIFQYFDDVYILTYMFRCQIQRYYYDFHNVDYTYYQVDENYKLVPFNIQRDIRARERIRPLVNIFEGKQNEIGNQDTALSLSWFRVKDEANVRKTGLQSALNNYFNNVHRKTKPKERLWTTFKEVQKDLQGKGYTKRFISINMRSTNEYIDSKALAYCCNRYVKPTVKIFFGKRGITIDEDDYATSEMIQWIWRSQIRRGQEISIYIPSKRMRTLLKQYLQLI